MTLTVWPCAVPLWAFARRSESSEAIRPWLPVWLDEFCPNAIPVAKRSVMLRRLPQAALCRSPRPFGFRNFSVCTMNLTLSFLMGERSSFYSVSPLHGSSQSMLRKHLFLLKISEFFYGRLSQCVPPDGAWDSLSRPDLANVTSVAEERLRMRGSQNEENRRRQLAEDQK